MVTALERQYDAFVAAQENRSLLARDEDLPSGDELGAEFERFLAQQAGEKFKDGSATTTARAVTTLHASPGPDDEVGSMTSGTHDQPAPGARGPSPRWSSAPSTVTGARSGSPARARRCC